MMLCHAPFDAGKLEFHGALAGLSNPEAFKRFLKRCRKTEWVVYSKPPFGRLRCWITSVGTPIVWPSQTTVC